MTKRSFFLLTLSTLMGLFLMSYPVLSMQTMTMDEMMVAQQSNKEHGSMGENSTGSCCDEIAPCSGNYLCLLPQYALIALPGGNKQVMNANPVAQSISLETQTPPPKA